MKQLILITTIFFSILCCNAKSEYRLEAIEGQMIQFDFVYDDAWPTTILTIVLNGDSIEFTPTGYENRIDCFNSIVDSIINTAKFMPEPYDSFYEAYNMMFNTKENFMKTSCENWGLEINEITAEFETLKLIPIDEGCLNIRFVNIQAIVMITSKENVGGVDYSEDIRYEKIPNEVYVPIFIINAEKTDDLKVKFKSRNEE